MRKHALTISWNLLAAMALGAVVRLALSPGLLQVPLAPGTPLATKGMLLLGLPLFQALMIFISLASLRSVPGTPANRQSWREYWGVFHLFITLFQLACWSMLMLNLSGIAMPFSPRPWLGRGLLVLSGLALVALFNRLPKMPPAAAAACLPRDPARWAPTARLISWIMVGLGLLMALTGLVGLTPQTAPYLSAVLTSFFAVALLAIVHHLWRSWNWAGK
jgi:hypothetical protein